MLLTAVAAIAAALSSPVYVSRSDAGHGWKPTDVEAKAIDQRIDIPASAGGPISRFKRYYTGVYRGGHRVLVVTLIVGSWEPGEPGPLHIVPPEEMPEVADAGCDVIHMSLDTQTHVASALECNSSLFVPPPPPPPPPPPQR